MTGKELVKQLQKDGWKLDRVNGSHHIMSRDKQTLSIPVHGNSDLSTGLLSKLLKQAGLK